MKKLLLCALVLMSACGPYEKSTDLEVKAAAFQDASSELNELEASYPPSHHQDPGLVRLSRAYAMADFASEHAGNEDATTLLMILFASWTARADLNASLAEGLPLNTEKPELQQQVSETLKAVGELEAAARAYFTDPGALEVPATADSVVEEYPGYLFSGKNMLLPISAAAGQVTATLTCPGQTSGVATLQVVDLLTGAVRVTANGGATGMSVSTQAVGNLSPLLVNAIGFLNMDCRLRVTYAAPHSENSLMDLAEVQVLEGWRLEHAGGFDFLRSNLQLFFDLFPNEVPYSVIRSLSHLSHWAEENSGLPVDINWLIEMRLSVKTKLLLTNEMGVKQTLRLREMVRKMPSLDEAVGETLEDLNGINGEITRILK